MFFFLVMVRLRYTPTTYDLTLDIPRLLRRILNINSHSDKMQQIERLIYKEWAIEFLEKIWKDDFIDFKTTIRKVQQNDRRFINFDVISIFEDDAIYNILRSK